MTCGELAAALEASGILSPAEAERFAKSDVDSTTARFLNVESLTEMGVERALTRARVLGWLSEHLGPRNGAGAGAVV